MSRNRVEPGQEYVWDYSSRLEATSRRIKIVFGGVTLAYTTRAGRVLESSHLPVYCVQIEDVKLEHLTLAEGGSTCAWKGWAQYYEVSVGGRTEPRAAWFYPDPTSSFAYLRDHVAAYPSKKDACWVGGEKVEAQLGDVYGGWITPEIVGPSKGEPGTWGW